MKVKQAVAVSAFVAMLAGVGSIGTTAYARSVLPSEQSVLVRSQAVAANAAPQITRSDLLAANQTAQPNAGVHHHNIDIIFVHFHNNDIKSNATTDIGGGIGAGQFNV